MNMKQLLALIMVLGLMLCLCACAVAEPKPTDPTTKGTEPSTEGTEPSTEGTEPTAESADDPTYVVTVVDQNNEPVAGAVVQLCLEACVPVVTDENGVANFYLEENDYKIAFPMMPAGYDYVDEQQEWHFADGENTITIVIQKVA